MLSTVVRGRRLFDRVDVKTAADQIGISNVTLRRVEAGGTPDLTTLRVVCKWLRIAPSVFIDDMDDGAPAVADMPDVAGMDDHIAHGPEAGVLN